MTYEEYQEMRDELKLTDYAISKATHVSRSAISQWKNGNTKLSDANKERLETFFKRSKMAQGRFHYEPLEMAKLFQKEFEQEFQEQNQSPKPFSAQALVKPNIQEYIFDVGHTKYTISMSNDEYNELQKAITAYIESWLKINNKVN